MYKRRVPHHLAELCQTDHLKSTTVGQHAATPTHVTRLAANTVKQFWACVTVSGSSSRMCGMNSTYQDDVIDGRCCPGTPISALTLDIEPKDTSDTVKGPCLPTCTPTARICSGLHLHANKISNHILGQLNGDTAYPFSAP